jgi:Protein of unknown function (DUF3347)
MRKFILLIVIFIIAGLLVYKLLSDKKTSPGPPPDQALKIGKNSSGFDSAFAGLMNEYFAVRDALVDWDTLKADQAAYRVAARADSLPLRMLKADSGIVMTAKSLAASIVGEAKGFVGETGIDGRRRSFDMLTSEMYDLVRTVQSDGEKIYHIRCPMAFGDSSEGFWLSNTAAIVNPYLGNKHPVYKAKMVGCGEVTDSLDFGKK